MYAIHSAIRIVRSPLLSLALFYIRLQQFAVGAIEGGKTPRNKHVEIVSGRRQRRRRRQSPAYEEKHGFDRRLAVSLGVPTRARHATER